ncbi:arylamine N-acetyltransferase [Winogradskya humida]|uniref:Arylamine N-acetyltransferase n=1 Tax=Winogradskya humida TaxID=113566 RepID=A0ABQ3ZWS0_9ACTN|nr:arylamine N-acetyltransferase [Actinoplanes humidus]GIE23057.1 hypothetical protein Ahu01nite_061590 [Actinoplanes humidus]
MESWPLPISIGTLDPAELVTTTVGVRITRWEPGRLVGTLPVEGNRDAYGRLDSAALAVLAETLGSVAAALEPGSSGIVLGQELSVAHHEDTGAGIVTGTCVPVHHGGSVSTYEIVVTAADGRRLCTARLTCRLRRTAQPTTTADRKVRLSMQSAPPPRDPYWERIGYHGPLEPTLDVLREICRKHVLEVPFEALEGPEGRRPVIDWAGAYDKIVTRRGGGFCLQANGLLAHQLRQIGFDVTELAAHIWVGHRGYFSKGGDHLILMVRIDGRQWLVDASYTSLVYVEPIELVAGEYHQDGWTYRVLTDDDWYVVQRRDDEGWLPLYRFVLSPRTTEFFLREAVAWHLDGETRSETARTLMCSRGIRGGKVWLVNNHLTVAERGTVTTRTVRDRQDCAEILGRIFRGHEDLAERGLRIWQQLQDTR